MELKDGKDMLRRAVPRPELPPGFRERLLVRMLSETSPSEMRAALEKDWQFAQMRLRAESVQLRWRTLIWLLGGAFAAGAVTLAAMPWVANHFGGHWSLWVPVAVASLGLVASWAGDSRVRRWLSGSGIFGA